MLKENDIKIIRTNSKNLAFIKLVKSLDIDLIQRDSESFSYFDQFNKIDDINYVVIAYLNRIAVSCGSIKEYNKNSMEIKRIYTLLKYRGKGLATKVVKELEKWAYEL